jgi:hypothetical protein
MKQAKRRLPIPQWEFGFAPDTFNLIVETGVDGERITHEHERIKKARQLAEKAQAPLLEIA